MIRLVMRIAADDATVKLLFDHVRNIGITALLFGAAAWRSSALDWSRPLLLNVMDAFTIALLMPLAVFLTMVNVHHGHDKLVAATAPKWVMLLYSVGHGFVGTAIVYSLIAVRLSGQQ
jgi:hypothetical protein